MDPFLVQRAVQCLLTLYMLMILIRWLGPYLELDLYGGRLSWIRRLTDPLINWLRRVLPPMGPLDFGPLAAVLLIWVLREFLVYIVLQPPAA